MIKQRADQLKFTRKIIEMVTSNWKTKLRNFIKLLTKTNERGRNKENCSEIIGSTKASSIKDMGKVMRVKKKFDTLDFLAGKVLKEILNKWFVNMKYPKEYLEEIKSRLKVSTWYLDL